MNALLHWKALLTKSLFLLPSIYPCFKEQKLNNFKMMILPELHSG